VRVCCGLTGHLELARRPDLYGSPVVVGDWEEHVVAASDEAMASGVLPGMASRQAEHLCPLATFLPPEPEAAAQLRELISSALYDLAPTVEVRVDGVAWLDVNGVVSAGESIREARRRLKKAIGREPRLTSSTLSPSRNTRVRKPSHLGSYSQLSPLGIPSPGADSIGSMSIGIGSFKAADLSPICLYLVDTQTLCYHIGGR